MWGILAVFVFAFLLFFSWTKNVPSESGQGDDFCLRALKILKNGQISRSPFRPGSSYGPTLLTVTGSLEGLFVTIRTRYFVRYDDPDLHRLDIEMKVPDPVGRFVIESKHKPVSMTTNPVINRAFVEVSGLATKYNLEGDKAVIDHLFRDKAIQGSIDGLFKARFYEIKMGEAGLLSLSQESRFIRPVLAEAVLGELAKIARAANLTEIEILEPGSTLAPVIPVKVESPKVHCPYCRDQLGVDQSKLSRCGLCKAIYHNECFEESGSCAVHGCEGQGEALDQVGQK